MISELLLKPRKEVLHFLKDTKSLLDSNNNKEYLLEKEKLKEFCIREGDRGLSYLQNLYKQIARENSGIIKVKFIEFYYKFLSPSIYKKNQSFISFLEEIKGVNDNFVYSEGKNDKKSVFSFYNKIMEDEDICKENKWKLITDFLQQKTENFKDFYNKHKYNYESLTQTFNECGLISVDDENSKILYKTYPWLENILLEKIYIGSSKYDIKKYISRKNDELIIPIEYESVDYYLPNDTFFFLISNQKNQRSQVQEDLVFVDRNNNELISFKILLKVFDLKDNTDKRLIQDEDIFQKENNYINNSLKGILNEYTVEAFMNSKIEDSHFKLAFDYLQKAITTLNPSSKYKHMNMSDYEKSKIKNVRDLLKEIAKITVYLHLDEIIDSIFKRRLMLDYYKVDKIFGLSVEEKIPELSLLDENDLNRVKIEKFIDELILVEMFDIGQMMFKIVHHIVGDNIELARNFGINEIQKVFYPSHNNVSKENVVYYDGDWYDLRHLLSGKNDGYPENDEYFTDIFVPRLRDVFEEDIEPTLSLEEHQEKYKNMYKFLEELRLFSIDLTNEEIFFDCPGEKRIDGESFDGDYTDYEDDDNDVDIGVDNDGDNNDVDNNDVDNPVNEINDYDDGNTNDWDSGSDDDYVLKEKENQKQKPIYNNDGFVYVERKEEAPLSSTTEESGVDVSKFDLTTPSLLQNNLVIENNLDGGSIKPIETKSRKKKNEPPPSYNYDEIDRFENDNKSSTPPPEEKESSVEMINGINKVTEKISTHCDKCGKVLKNYGITTYQHSSTDLKDVRSVTMCIDCLKSIEIVDFK